MSEETQEMDLIEDVTEEQLIANEELEQDLPEVSEEQEVVSFSESVKSILLGEKKAVKENDDEEEEEDDEEDDEEEEMDESADLEEALAIVESEEDEEEEEMDESVQSDDEEADKETLKNIKKSAPKKAAEPKGGSPKTDEKKFDGQKAADDLAKSVKESLSLLIDNESSLSEDFKTSASHLFEAAVAEKVLNEKAKMQAEFDTSLAEQVENIRESLIDRIDNYLSYVVESWVEDNQVAVESKVRTEVAESFIGSLKDLFVENYIEIPESKADKFEELTLEVSAVKDELQESASQVEKLSEEIELLKREKILYEKTKDLPLTQQEKLKALSEELQFENEAAFGAKLTSIKSSLFESSQDAEEISEEGEIEHVVEGVEDPQSHISNDMKRYMSALTGIKNNNPFGK